MAAHFLWSFLSLFQQHSSTATVKKGPPCVSSNKKLAPSASDIVQIQMTELCTTEEAFSQLLYGFCVGCSINSTTHVVTSALVNTSAHTGTHIPTVPAHTNAQTLSSRHIQRACGCDRLLLFDCKIILFFLITWATCVFKSANDYFVLITEDWTVYFEQWTSIVKWMCGGILRHFVLVNKDVEVQSKMYFKEHVQPPNNHLCSAAGDISYGSSSQFLK